MQKTLLILGVVCFQVAFGVFSEIDLSPSQKDCANEFNLDEEEFLKYVNEDWTLTEGNPDVNGISLCTFRLQHFLKNDDSYDVDKYRDALVNEYFIKHNYHFDNPTEVALTGIEACQSVQGSDLGDKIVKHHNCIINYFKNIA